MTITKDRSSLAPTFGWMRRPELDREGRDAWEKPSGKIVFVAAGVTPKVVRLGAILRSVLRPTPK